MTYTHILFDLDGTLTDPGAGITNSVAYALERYGIHVSDRRTLYPFIGPPLTDSFQRFYGFSAADARAAVDVYREYFAGRGIFENEKSAGLGKFPDCRHIGKAPVQVHCKYPARFRRAGSLEFRRVDIESLFVGLHQHGNEARGIDRKYSRYVSVRRHQNFITGSDTPELNFGA